MFLQEPWIYQSALRTLQQYRIQAHLLKGQATERPINPQFEEAIREARRIANPTRRQLAAQDVHHLTLSPSDHAALNARHNSLLDRQFSLPTREHDDHKPYTLRPDTHPLPTPGYDSRIIQKWLKDNKLRAVGKNYKKTNNQNPN